MARRDLHIHACEQGGFAIYCLGVRSEPAPFGGHMPVAAFGTLGEALGFIQKEMAPEKPKEPARSSSWDLPGPEPR